MKIQANDYKPNLRKHVDVPIARFVAFQLIRHDRKTFNQQKKKFAKMKGKIKSAKTKGLLYMYIGISW